MIVLWEYMITDLVQIKRLGEKNRPDNLRFRRWIKSHTFVERQFRRAAEEVHDAIDCRQCAECCRVTEVQLVERDIESLARFLGLKPQKFLEQYTTKNSDGELILQRNAGGCVFLDGNDCTVYDARPATASASRICCAAPGPCKAACGNSPTAPPIAPLSTTGWKKLKA